MPSDAGRQGVAQSDVGGHADGRERLAQSLGWFSLGLGLAETVWPSNVARAVGARPHKKTRTTLRVMGVREMAAGAGLLAARRPAAFAWMRAAGDLLDLALLGQALGARGARRHRLTAAIGASPRSRWSTRFPGGSCGTHASGGCSRFASASRR